MLADTTAVILCQLQRSARPTLPRFPAKATAIPSEPRSIHRFLVPALDCGIPAPARTL
jgi:hypothetical protein